MEFKEMEFDYVVTVYDKAGEACPIFLGGQNFIHKSFEDPSRFIGSEEEIMTEIRKTKDRIKIWIMDTFSKK